MQIQIFRIPGGKRRKIDDGYIFLNDHDIIVPGKCSGFIST